MLDILITCNHKHMSVFLPFFVLSLCRSHLENYTSDYTIQVLVGYCVVYIFMQTFMIPGTVFMSLLAGSLFGVVKGVALVVFTATAGASSCYFLSKFIGRPLVFSLWPDKLSFFQAQVNECQQLLVHNVMVFWWEFLCIQESYVRQGQANVLGILSDRFMDLTDKNVNSHPERLENTQKTIGRMAQLIRKLMDKLAYKMSLSWEHHAINSIKHLEDTCKNS